MRFCNNCGKPLVAGAKFCMKCGARVEGGANAGASSARSGAPAASRPSQPQPVAPQQPSQPVAPQLQQSMMPPSQQQMPPVQPQTTPMQGNQYGFPTQPMPQRPQQPQLQQPQLQQSMPQKPKKSLKQRFTEMTGGEGEQLYKFHKLFSGIFQHRTQDDWDVLITSGSSRARRKVMLPWLFLRVFIISAIAFALMIGAYKLKPEYVNLYPGLMFTGALMVPLAVVIFFWECEWTRTISFMNVLMMILVGGALSLIFTIALPRLGQGDMTLNPILAFLEAGLPEEIAKALAVFALLRILKVEKISSALVVGSSVGGGFAFMETMGYGLSQMMQAIDLASGTQYSVDYGKSWQQWEQPVRILAIFSGRGGDSINTLIIRAIVAPGGHVVWAAITAAAFMLALKAGKDRIGFTTISWKKFLPLFCVPIVLHTLWDATILGSLVANLLPYSLLGMPASVWIEFFILTLLAWIVLTRLLNAGFRQYRDDFMNSAAAHHA